MYWLKLCTSLRVLSDPSENTKFLSFASPKFCYRRCSPAPSDVTILGRPLLLLLTCSHTHSEYILRRRQTCPDLPYGEERGKNGRKCIKKKGLMQKGNLGGLKFPGSSSACYCRKFRRRRGLAKRGREIRVSIDACLELVMLHYTHTIPTFVK